MADRDDSEVSQRPVRLTGESREGPQASFGSLSSGASGSRTASSNVGPTEEVPVIIGDGEEDDVLDLRAAGGVPSDEPDRSQLPHWTDPPTGEIPGVSQPLDATSDEGSSPSSSWKHRASTDDEPTTSLSLSQLSQASGLGEGTDAHAGETPTGASTDDTSTFDASADASKRARGGTRFREPAALVSSSFRRRVITGLAIGAVALGAFAAGPPYTAALVTAVVLLGVIEVFDGLRRAGYRPATALALLGSAAVLLGVYARGEAAISLVVAVVVVFTFLWYLNGVIKGSPTANIAATLTGFVWVGVLGSFAMLMLRAPQRHGIAFILGLVLVTVAYDTFAYVGGSVVGRHLLAPSISPGKTWEGALCGTLASILVGTLLVQAISPWTLWSGFLLGLTASVFAPIGDLAESMIKRDLGLKDMGRLLPGHGGVMDRLDGLLFVLPATYYLVRILDLM